MSDDDNKAWKESVKQYYKAQKIVAAMLCINALNTINSTETSNRYTLALGIGNACKAIIQSSIERYAITPLMGPSSVYTVC